MEEKVLIESQLDAKSMIALDIIFVIAYILASIICYLFTMEMTTLLLWFGIYFIPIIVIIVFIHILFKSRLVITNKRVYGTAFIRSRVDLPFDSVIAVSMGGFKSVAVVASSVTVKFWFIKNCTEMHAVLIDLLLMRQETNCFENGNVTFDAAEEIKKFKELLDTGAITQEEYDDKKKQLLAC